MKLNLEFEDFVASYNAGLIRCIVDPSKAMHVCDSFKGPTAWLYESTKAVGCLGMLSGLILFFVITWWKALLWIVAGGVFVSLCRALASQNVRQLALQDPHFYNQMVAHNVITVVKVG